MVWQKSSFLIGWWVRMLKFRSIVRVNANVLYRDYKVASLMFTLAFSYTFKIVLLK